MISARRRTDGGRKTVGRATIIPEGVARTGHPAEHVGESHPEHLHPGVELSPGPLVRQLAADQSFEHCQQHHRKLERKKKNTKRRRKYGQYTVARNPKYTVARNPKYLRSSVSTLVCTATPPENGGVLTRSSSEDGALTHARTLTRTRTRTRARAHARAHTTHTPSTAHTQQQQTEGRGAGRGGKAARGSQHQLPRRE